MKLLLVFEHIDQDLAHYLQKVPSPGLGPDRIRVSKSHLRFVAGSETVPGTKDTGSSRT